MSHNKSHSTLLQAHGDKGNLKLNVRKFFYYYEQRVIYFDLQLRVLCDFIGCGIPIKELSTYVTCTCTTCMYGRGSVPIKCACSVVNYHNKKK